MGTVYTLLRVSLFQKIIFANLALLVIGLASVLLLTDMDLGSVLRPQNGLLAGAVLLAATVVNIVLVHHALRPIRSLERTAERFQEGDENARAQTTTLADPGVTGLVHAFNEMLDRQVQAHRRERDRAARTLRLMDAENSRSAAALYDGLAQTLAGVLLRLRVLGRSPAFAEGDRDHEAAVRALGEVRAEVLEALEEARGIARRLHPPELKELGLTSALEALARAFTERTGLNVVVRADRALPTLPPDVELAVFRIAQEGLRNVVQHAEAGVATIALEPSSTEFTMRICDDGSGFDASSVLTDARGLGLAAVQERAAQAGGRVTILSHLEEGTCIELTVPVPERDRTDSPLGHGVARAVGSGVG